MTTVSIAPAATLGRWFWQAHEALRVEQRADVGEGRVAVRKMAGDRREDVAAVKRRGRDWQPQVAVRELPHLVDPTQRLRGWHEEPVVRPDQDVAAGCPNGDRPALSSDTGVDDRDVHPGREVRQRESEQEAAIADRVLPHRVPDVDDLRVAADREHYRPAGRGRAVQPEVGEEADHGARTLGRLHGWQS